MNIYLAARWKNRRELRPIRDRIEALGHKVTSRWIDIDVDDEADKTNAAYRDINDINDARLLIIWPDLQENVKPTYGGCFVEFGYALAVRKELWVVDNTSPCVFLNAFANRHFNTWDEALEALATGGRHDSSGALPPTD